jgi:uncharacterized membrane protein YphA (DoxX/SURF4 family)
MAKKAGFTLGSIVLLQLALGVFFLVLGISNLGNYDSSLSELKRAFGKDDTLSLVTAIAELVMGAILLLGLFMSVSADMAKVFSIALFALWALYMIMAFLAKDFLEPNFLTWLYRVSWHSVILISIWIVGRRYM